MLILIQPLHICTEILSMKTDFIFTEANIQFIWISYNMHHTVYILDTRRGQWQGSMNPPLTERKSVSVLQVAETITAEAH